MNVKVVNQVHGGPMPQEFFAGHAVLIWLLRRALYASDAVSVLSSKEYEAYTAFFARGGFDCPHSQCH
ncbi:hypothetical protein ACFS07_02520 [Undibacterium arcticum]